MNSTVIAFPTARAAKPNAPCLPRGAANVVSLERWKRRARPRRTATGVFFMSHVLRTTGDFA